MALTGRTALVAALGAAVVWVLGSGRAVLGVEAVLVCAVLLDLLGAARLRDLRFERDGPTAARLGESVALTLRVTNTGPRRLRGRLRDAWVPSAGADLTHHQLDLPPGEGRLLTTTLRPTRRGTGTPTGSPCGRWAAGVGRSTAAHRVRGRSGCCRRVRQPPRTPAARPGPTAAYSTGATRTRVRGAHVVDRSTQERNESTPVPPHTHPGRVAPVE